LSKNFVENFVEFRRFLREVTDEVLDKGQKPEVLGQALARIASPMEHPELRPAIAADP
jgi:hypothetical protein